MALAAMGYNARNDEIRDNITRMRREWEAQRGALATVRRLFSVLRRGFFSLVRAINHTTLHASRLTGNSVVVSRYTDFCSTIFLV